MTATHIPLISYDVERLLVEIAIEEAVCQSHGDPTAVSGLLYTCKRFNEWALPCIYHSIHIRSVSRMSLLSQTLSKSPFLASLVKALVVPMSTTYDEVARVIPLCHNLTSLAYWRALPQESSPIDWSTSKALRRLSIESDSRPMFLSVLTRLTHLDLCVRNDRSPWYPTIKSLVNLTHLCLPVHPFNPSNNPDIDRLPSSLPPNLRICILYSLKFVNEYDFAEAKPLALGEIDPRIVVGIPTKPLKPMPFPYVCRSAEQVLSDWALLNKEPDFWHEAEAIVNSRSSSIASNDND